MDTTKQLLKSPLLRAFLVASILALLGLTQLSKVHAASNQKQPQDTEQASQVFKGDTINNPGPIKPKSAPPSQSPDNNQTQDETENSNLPPAPKKQ